MYDTIYKEEFYDDGTIFCKGHTCGGIRVGYWEAYHSNGKLRWFATFSKDSNFVGYSEDYHHDGTLDTKEFYL